MDNTVGSLRQSAISSREKEIILGTILGDAHLSMLKFNARLELGHSETQKAYVFWKYQELKKFTGTKPVQFENFDQRAQKTYVQWRFKTKTHTYFTELWKLFYKGKRKIVPSKIVSLLTSPLTLAVWYMDDGGRRNDCYGVFLNTLSFTKRENEILAECLQRNFSLNPRIHWIQDGYRLYIPSRDAQKFSALVDPYLLDLMKYKLPYNPVTTSFARLNRARDRVNAL
ncbi:MAG: homing endonuclease [Parcubacteria group bacterium Greene0714_21]|nr:MAG: homing endonuclease [Parcubacteria group bacterium Greene0416_39]TSD04516.1 MAG: homing endonuclease [Parcubacteria group bacterium Greene0714_21]